MQSLLPSLPYSSKLLASPHSSLTPPLPSEPPASPRLWPSPRRRPGGRGGAQPVLGLGLHPTHSEVRVGQDLHIKLTTSSLSLVHWILSNQYPILVVSHRYSGIPRLITLLSDANVAVAGSAAGALQNISRELASRLLIRWVPWKGSVVGVGTDLAGACRF